MFATAFTDSFYFILNHVQERSRGNVLDIYILTFFFLIGETIRNKCTNLLDSMKLSEDQT